MIVYLRRIMGLENVTYRSMLPQNEWQPISEAGSDSSDRRNREENWIESFEDEESDRGEGEYEWEGPPGDPLFPDVYPYFPRGR